MNCRAWVVAIAVSAVSVPAAAIEWPQEVKAPAGTIIVYQPQPEKLTGNQLTGRAAISVQLKDKPQPIFGAFWFSARIDTDRERGMALVRDVKVTQVRWPDVTDEGAARFTQIVEDTLPKAGFEVSIAVLSESLATAEREERSLTELKNDPPKIVFSEELAVLLMYDGEPRFVPIEHTTYERALNTPFAVVRDQKTQRVYLTNGASWYVANEAKGPFEALKSPPADVKLLVPTSEAPTKEAAAAPKIVVATTPTELVATQGKPSWKSLAGGKLLYVANTETPWLRDLTDQQLYLLLSGRWFRAASQSGPWSFVRADRLPESFKDIPPGSEIGGLRVSVAGTEEAEAAVLDARIPQTAAIVRSAASLEVKYDGEPKFEKIAGTNVSAAVNTGSQVLLINQRYYAVDNGVWFTAARPTGPWVVADQIPEDEIAKIPPSSPLYNTTYVTIYDSTPEVVYVGYTPGYMWSYPYYGVPVYGTGYVYPPYWGAVYYPRPPTWGLHVGYNPWTGWRFGVSWSNGFMTVGASWGYGGGAYYRPGGCCGGWYGGGYRGPVVVHHHHGNVNIGNTVNIGNSVNRGNRGSSGNQVSHYGARDRPSQSNLYRQGANNARVAERPAAGRDLNQARPANGRANDVFADRSGSVARRSGEQWQVRDGGTWKSSGGLQDRPAPTSGRDPGGRDSLSPGTAARDFSTSQPGTRPAQGWSAPSQQSISSSGRPSPSQSISSSSRPSPNIDRSDLNRAAQARQSGMSRASSFGGGGFRGGGGRR